MMKTSIMLDIFDILIKYLKTNGINKLIYKTIPHIYHRIPSEEDFYAIIYNNGKLIRRDVTSTVDLHNKIGFANGKKRNVKKSENIGLNVSRSYDYKSFMAIMEETLKKYDTKPIHSAKEIILLASRFPDNIKLFTALKDEKMLSGVLVYESNNVAHAQYIGASKEGLKDNATDFIMDYLINTFYNEKKYFDLGISTEQHGKYLNKSLIASKERFGARAVVHDFYEIKID